MAEITRIKFGALNVTASPHPKGVYESLFRDAADQEVPVWGSDWAFITEPDRPKSQLNWLRGRVLLFTKIDRDGKWLNKKKKDEATREEKQKVNDAIPADFEPNYRTFNYIFVEDRHRLVIEVENELGQRFGALRAERFFSRLFSPDYMPKTSPLIDVTAIPEEETLERILKMPRLRRLEIVVKRPNPDDSGDLHAEIMNRLTQQGARSQKFELAKAPGVKEIIPDAETEALAKVGAENGYVTGEGKDATGKRIFESTRDHPKIRQRDVVDSSMETMFSSVRLFL